MSDDAADGSFAVLGAETALQHPYVTVEMQHIKLPDGREIPDWPIVITRDFVNGVVLNEQGQVMIIEGYKHGLGRSSWQVVGGYVEDGEDPADTVKRELLEETGFASDNWRFLGTFVMDANRKSGTGHFFLAVNARQVAQPDHDDLETFAINWVSPQEAQAALFDGRMGVASYAVNLAMALLVLRDL